MKKFRYQNISNQTQALIGYGVVESGKIIETNNEIVNQNFKLVENEPRKTESRFSKLGELKSSPRKEGK